MSASFGAPSPFSPVARRHIGFDAQNGFQLSRTGGVVELDASVQVPMVGNGYGCHAQFRNSIHQAANSVSSIKE